jgi:predicted RNA-binding Zn ribbon-like protein
MVMSADIAALELYGGHPALELANTREGVRGEPPGREHLHDYADCVGWAVRVGVLDEAGGAALLRRARRRPEAAAAAHGRALALRRTVFEVFDTLAAAGEPAPPAALAALRDAYADAVAHATLSPGGDGRHGWRWEGDDLDRPLWPIAVAAVDLLCSPDLDRLGACDQCVGLFLDRSRNRSRRWCMMRECGSQVKMRRYRAAHRG